MSLRRRFVYLVMKDPKRRDFPLRLIDAARLFFPNGEMPPPPATTTPPPTPPEEDARLPPPVVRFSAPATATRSGTSQGAMEFMLLHGSGCSGGGAGGRWRRRVVATDHTGRCVLYEPARGAVRALPELAGAPMASPVALPVGDDELCVIDTHFHDACFHRLLFHPDPNAASAAAAAAYGDWEWRRLPPPPYDDPESHRGRAHITSYAVVGGAGGGGGGGASVWVSKDGLGTHCFNVGAGEWAKAGDWALPFCGAGTYVPEHKLWFGLAGADKSEDGGVVCATDLTSTSTTTPPAPPRVLWREPPTPPELEARSSYLVHLGRSKFCLARFFKIVRGGCGGATGFAVFSGLEVHGDGEQQELRMVKHRSQRFSLVNKLILWVL